MALICLVSASGSPGVTTTALGLALTWGRPVVLVEADPTGGSAVMAGYLRGTATPPDSLIDLALAHREDRLVAALAQARVALPNSTATLVPGTRSHDQAGSLAALWEPLTLALKGLERTGQDVVVDAGRLGLAGSPTPLLFGADLTLLVVRSNLVALAGARSWAQTLREHFDQLGSSSLGLLVIGEGDPYGAREISKVLRVPVLACVGWDPATAAVLSRGAPIPNPTGFRAVLGRAGRRDPLQDSVLLRGIRAARSAAQDTVLANQAELAAPLDAGAGSRR